MIYKVGISGATGKMGTELTTLLQAGFNSRGDSFEFSSDEPVHVWIDFSQPKGTMALLERIQTPVVIGTTGFSESEIHRIQEYSKKAPVLLSSNMSPGMNLVLSMLEKVHVPQNFGFDVSVHETHHTQKKDSPSGTALTILKTLNEAGQEKVDVQSLRAGSVKGVHKVSFIGQDEEFSIEHRVFNRSVFARGALLAAHFILNKAPGLYSMQDLWAQSEVEP